MASHFVPPLPTTVRGLPLRSRSRMLAQPSHSSTSPSVSKRIDMACSHDMARPNWAKHYPKKLVLHAKSHPALHWLQEFLGSGLLLWTISSENAKKSQWLRCWGSGRRRRDWETTFKLVLKMTNLIEDDQTWDMSQKPGFVLRNPVLN